MTTPQDTQQHARRALQEVLAGRVPSHDDLVGLQGDVKACLDALVDTLHQSDVQGVRKAFTALVVDRPWLGKLASMSAESEADAQEPVPKRRIRFLPTSAFLERPSQQWLIPGILPRDGVTLVYGYSGTYKSFLVMDWSMCIATGTPWLGRSVTRGSVAYIAAEGSYGIGKRVKAWMAFHERTNPDDIAVQWFDESLLLQEPAHIAELITALQEDFAAPPVLVVIDTLSRCSAGANEDSNSDMAKIIASADIVRQQFHATVLIVHHVGKDTGRGPRGASALTGNAETLIGVSPTTVGSKVESIKSKDAPPFRPLSLVIQEVRFGPLPDDCSLVLTLGNADEDEEKPLMSKAETTMYTVLLGKELSYSDWLKAGTNKSLGDACLTERFASEAIAKLKRAGRVQQHAKRGPYHVVVTEETPPLDSQTDHE